MRNVRVSRTERSNTITRIGCLIHLNRVQDCLALNTGDLGSVTASHCRAFGQRIPHANGSTLEHRSHRAVERRGRLRQGRTESYHCSRTGSSRRGRRLPGNLPPLTGQSLYRNGTNSHRTHRKASNISNLVDGLRHNGNYLKVRTRGLNRKTRGERNRHHRTEAQKGRRERRTGSSVRGHNMSNNKYANRHDDRHLRGNISSRTTLNSSRGATDSAGGSNNMHGINRAFGRLLDGHLLIGATRSANGRTRTGRRNKGLVRMPALNGGAPSSGTRATDGVSGRRLLASDRLFLSKNVNRKGLSALRLVILMHGKQLKIFLSTRNMTRNPYSASNDRSSPEGNTRPRLQVTLSTSGTLYSRSIGQISNQDAVSRIEAGRTSSRYHRQIVASARRSKGRSNVRQRNFLERAGHDTTGKRRHRHSKGSRSILILRLFGRATRTNVRDINLNSSYRQSTGRWSRHGSINDLLSTLDKHLRSHRSVLARVSNLTNLKVNMILVSLFVNSDGNSFALTHHYQGHLTLVLAEKGSPDRSHGSGSRRRRSHVSVQWFRLGASIYLLHLHV